MRGKRYSLIIAGVCILAFLLTLVYPQFMINNFALDTSQILWKPWMLVTHIFIHRTLQHLVYNLIALVFFGVTLENLIGSKKFLLLFFCSGLFAGLGGLPYQVSLGASGAIFGLIGTSTILRPKMIVYAFGVPMYLVVAAGLWAFFDLIGTFAPDHVAHLAHLFGLFFGIGIGLKLKGKYREIKKEPEVEISEERLKEWERKYLMG